MTNPQLSDEPVQSWMLGAVAFIGGSARRTLALVGETTRFMRSVAVSFRDVATWRPLLGAQAMHLGVGSLPIGLFIAAFTGIVLALLASYSFSGAVPLYFVGTLVGKTVMLELAPVLTGLALAGRVGANIAAELGTMRVTEQIDALETLGYDPIAYLVVPRVIASTVMFPVIVAAAMMMGVLCGWAASGMLLHIASAEFVKGMGSSNRRALDSRSRCPVPDADCVPRAAPPASGARRRRRS
jgi:phospholipid/cholesterol/gamma-HCH transport system permease protein